MPIDENENIKSIFNARTQVLFEGETIGKEMKTVVRSTAAFLLLLSSVVSGQCPWHKDVVELQSACLCSYNLGHELSVQCDTVDWPKLLATLTAYATSIPLDLLYVNNSTVGELRNDVFADLQIHNVQLSGCRIRRIESRAFAGQEDLLKNLNLQENDLTEVPVASLRALKRLSLLDLSHNRIRRVANASFASLTKLTTLKLSDNNVTLEDGALDGLENSLKNLNLKGTLQKRIPRAVRGMKTLAFLDLSQNSLRTLPGPDEATTTFDGLESLTALNLERNVIQTLEADAFHAIRGTLSSLSLLNNLLPDFPTEAIRTLKELRVLDIGFNLLTELPDDAFAGNPSLTLLALDGNPLATVPFAALSHLNGTLRGLSIGGRFLHCDCRLAWIVDWIRIGDLQVTSRERNPQFCGSPPRFRDRGFYSIQPEELACVKKEPIGIATVVNSDLEDVSLLEAAAPKGTTASTTSTATTTKEPTSTSTTVSTTSTSTTKTTVTSSTSKVTAKTTASTKPSIASTITTTMPTTTAPSATSKQQKISKSTLNPWRNNNASPHQRPSLVMGFPNNRKSGAAEDGGTEVMVRNAFRQDNSVIIQWGSETANILGFRVVYRLFGDKSFKQGPPLEASEREFKIKNVPSQECIVVCVVSLEEINVTPDNVPYSQCREVRTVTTAATNMDKITIAASAAICGTIVVAVIVFVAASRRRTKKLHELHRQKMGLKNGLPPPPVTGLPINCCPGLGPNGSPGGPLSSLAALNAFNGAKDWDQVSGYSTHSTQRPSRMYALDQPSSLQDDLRSHFSSKGTTTKNRSMADGQSSQHSFSNQSSARYMGTGGLGGAYANNLLASRQDLRQSRQSLAVQSDRASRNSHHHHAPHSMTTATTSSTRRSRPRSSSRDEHQRRGGNGIGGSRYSTGGSTHTLNNYGDHSDNWTDHDMDIYMARNATTRNGLVPL